MLDRTSCLTRILPRDPRTTEACRTLLSVERYETMEGVIAMRATLVCAPTAIAGLTDDDITACLATLGGGL